MTSIGNIVSKFQVKEEDEAAEKAKENRAPIAASGADGGGPPDVPPGGGGGGGEVRRPRPAPPGRKPTKLPTGVALRKQMSADHQGQQGQHQGQQQGQQQAGAGRGATNRQSSVSFTTEDLDLFQRRPKYTEPPPPPADKPELRRSRKDNGQDKESSSVKRRSRSVGAPAFGGIRPVPAADKPRLPTKPKLADKPTSAQKGPSGLPRPFQVPRPGVASTDPASTATSTGLQSGLRNKSYRHATRQGSTARPTSGTRPTSGSRSRAGSLTKSRSEDGPSGLTSPTSPTGGARPVTRSRAGSGSHRPPSGSNQGSAGQYARSRPFAGSKPPGRTPSGRVKTAAQNANAQSDSNQSKPVETTSLQYGDGAPSKGPTEAVDVKRKDNLHSVSSGIPVPRKVAPKVSPKPSVSPRVSPAVSPKPVRALFGLKPTGEQPEVDVKAFARDNILSALARRSGIPPVKQTVVETPAVQSNEPLYDDIKSSDSVKNEGSPSHSPEFSEPDRLSVTIEGVTTTCTTDQLNKGPASPEIQKLETKDLSRNVSVEKDNNDNTGAVQTKATTEKSISEASSPIPQSPVSEVKIADSPSGSPRLKPKKPVVKPTTAPPPPPSQTRTDTTPEVSPQKPTIAPPPPPPQTRTDTAPEVSPQKTTEVRNGHDGVVTKSPLAAHTKLVKCGLDEKGSDVPPCKLIGGGSPKSVSPDRAAPTTQRVLPLKVFSPEHKGSSSSLDSYRKDSSLPASDSNFDADDEDEQAANNTVSQNPKICVKSFSVEQGDLSFTPVNTHTKLRPSSAAASGESDSSSIGSGDSTTGRKKGNGVIDKLRKISLSLLPSEIVNKSPPAKAIFYEEEDATEPQAHVEGKSVFYSSDSVTNGDSTTSQDEGIKKATSSPVERRKSKVSLRQKTCAAERKLSNRSGVFVENDFYEGNNGNHAYENVLFGPITTTKSARAKSSSLESIEGKQTESTPSKNTVKPSEPMEAPTEEGKPGERTSTDTADEDVHPNIYDNVKPTNDNIYANMAFTGYGSRSVWRRKTIKKHPTRKRQAAGDGGQPKDGAQTPETFEDFSNSDDSFDSDSFTDESDEEKDKIEATYAPVEGEAPVEEEVSPMTKLKRIATEILSTERAYVKRLHLIDQVFHFRTVIENRAHHMFPDDVIPQMFSNIKSIYQFHHDFLLPQLEKRMAEWDKTPKVGDLMRKFAPFLKLYSEYVKNFDHAVNTINSWQQRSHLFANLLIELQKKPECGMLTLQHHMLEPIQRVPRYELLLKDYLKHLPEDSEDEVDTQKALELVTTAATHANETMWKIEKFRKLLELNEMFGGMVDLIDPSRELVKEGKIMKISARSGLVYDRYLFLFNDMLLLCQNHGMGLTGSYRIKNLLTVEGMQVLEGDNLETPFTFYVKCKSKTIELHSNTREEKLEWFVTIENVIADYTRKQMSRLAGLKAMETIQKNLGDFAPTWVKDQNTSMCMLCGTPFSMLKRRHHCRCCGIVVCARCSSHKAPLAYQNNKPDRVCDNCYRTLSGRQEQDATAHNDNQPPMARIKRVLQVKGSDPSVVSGLMQLSSDKKIWERRWFALHENFVLYTFKAPQDVHAITSMPLPGYTVCEATKDDQVERDRVIKLFHSGTKKTYYFHVDNTSNLTKWLTGLQYAVKAELPPDYEPPKKE